MTLSELSDHAVTIDWAEDITEDNTATEISGQMTFSEKDDDDRRGASTIHALGHSQTSAELVIEGPNQPLPFNTLTCSCVTNSTDNNSAWAVADQPLPPNRLTCSCLTVSTDSYPRHNIRWEVTDLYCEALQFVTEDAVAGVGQVISKVYVTLSPSARMARVKNVAYDEEGSVQEPSQDNLAYYPDSVTREGLGSVVHGEEAVFSWVSENSYLAPSVVWTLDGQDVARDAEHPHNQELLEQVPGQSYPKPQTPIPYDRGKGSASRKMELSWNGGPPPLLSRMVGPVSGESQHNTGTEANSYSSHGTLAQDATILTVNDYIFLINRTGVFFTAGREQEPGITMLISIPCSRHGEEQCARGDLETGKHMIPVNAPTPNKTSFPYDPGGGSIVRGTEHGMPAVLRSYSLISESAASLKQALGSQKKDFVLVDIREGLERCEVIAVSEQKSFEDVQQTKGDSSEILTS